jgi:DNA helicase-2/ATP-dependent DNA helicase PcrA
MSALEICEKRQAILNQDGHALVTGGPGSGKTTIALLKAQRSIQSLTAGQRVLFLSFSRAAVYQVLKKSETVLTPSERALIQVQTYHAFCLEVLESHGRLLNGRSCGFIFPGEERLRKSGFGGDWDNERIRLAKTESQYCFDLLASGVAELLARSRAVRKLYGMSFPLIIVDEFQDTDDDQWTIVRALATVSKVCCLADPDQRIFDYRPDVSPIRVDQLRETLSPPEFDLGGDNHRSPMAGILKFANAVLKNHGPLPATDDVRTVSYKGRDFGAMFHASVVWTFSELRKLKIADPTVAVLCRTNVFVAELSTILREEHTVKKNRLAPIAHDVVWDAELAAAAGTIVASIMEWSSGLDGSLSKTLDLLCHYYRLKNAEHPSNAAKESIKKYLQAAESVAVGEQPKYKAGKLISVGFSHGIRMIGDPVVDWLEARKLLQNALGLSDVFRDASMVRLFAARDVLATGLAELWLSKGNYNDAANIVKSILERERFLAVDRPPRGCMIMTIHKSKGKEFDAVVMVEGAYKSQFFDGGEKRPHEKSRRLLRVGLTRARSLVTLVRPQKAIPLVS